jgi:hypothetical protein
MSPQPPWLLVTPQEKPLIAQLVSVSQPPPWLLVTP